MSTSNNIFRAAVTPSPEARNQQRLALAAAKGLEDQVEAVLDETTDAAASAPLARVDPDDTPAAPELSPEAAAKLQKLDEKLGLTRFILSVSDNGYGKCTDIDAYCLQTRGGKGAST